VSEFRSLRQLLNTLPQIGRVEWLGLRPARGVPMMVVQEVSCSKEAGLIGDRFSGRSDNPRQVTLIQYEHLSVLAGCLQRPSVAPELLRRNIVVSGINLLALKDKTFQLGAVALEYTGLCHPCSKMERHLGPGGYNAMRGHGGITAKVVTDGLVQVGERLTFLG